jgi:hypothetical protein
MCLTGDQDVTDNQELPDEPLSNDAAKTLAKEILHSGAVVWYDHARSRLAKWNMTAVDVENIIKGGWVDLIEQVAEGPWYGAWRYRFTTRTMCVVIQFTSKSEMVPVTVWRL